jgi:hypothetical protein
LRRAEWANSASNPHRYAASGEPQITLDKINKVTLFSCVTNCARSPELREAYARLVTDELGVRQGEICINGSKSVQRSGCTCGSLSCSGVAPRGDSNLRLSGICAFRPQQPLSLARRFPTNLGCWLVGSEPNEDRVSQQSVGSPGQIGNLRDQPRLNSMHAGKNERRSEARLAGRRQA